MKTLSTEKLRKAKSSVNKIMWFEYFDCPVISKKEAYSIAKQRNKWYRKIINARKILSKKA